MLLRHAGNRRGTDVEIHGYAPPEAFQVARSDAPLPGTPKYEDAVQRFRSLHVRAVAQRRRRWSKAGGRQLAGRWLEGDKIT